VDASCFVFNAVRGADCVKGDFRVAQDNVGVVAHSSPILWYESPECKGKLIENMTSAQVTQCHLTVTSQTYITVPHLLEWAQVSYANRGSARNNNSNFRASRSSCCA
jgi:hypothetical protein